MPETLVPVLFGDLADPGGLDANEDGALTAADILLPHGLLFNGSIADLVPHAVGDQLIYRVTDPLGRVTTETTLVTSADVAGAFVVDDRAVNPAQQLVKHETQSYIDTGNELLFGGGDDVLRDLRTVCTPFLLRLTIPLIAGQTSSTTVRCDVRIISRDIPVGFIARTDMFTPVEWVDTLTVPAGTYTQVLHVSGSTNLSGDVENNEIYIAPGIGAILQIATASGQITRRELIGGTIGGEPVAR